MANAVFIGLIEALLIHSYGTSQPRRWNYRRHHSYEACFRRVLRSHQRRTPRSRPSVVQGENPGMERKREGQERSCRARSSGKLGSASTTRQEQCIHSLRTGTLTCTLGPDAAAYLQGLTSFDLKQLTFGTTAFVPIEGFNLHVARGGYTGEDGFEVSRSVFCCVLSYRCRPNFLPQISIPPSQTVEVAELLSKSPVQLIGLGARDSLRLEAGMCLYGNDLDETTTPVEAGLSWVIGKSLL